MVRPTRSTAGCCVFVTCVVIHVQTHVFTQLLRVLYVHLHPNKWGLTHTGDSVIGEVAAFTLALETTGNVVTFLVASGWKFRIGTLVDVCAGT